MAKAKKQASPPAVDPQHHLGVVHPHLVYSVAGLARALGKSVRWVQDNLIRSDAVVHRKRGEFIGIPGWVIINWVEEDLRTHSEWQDARSGQA